MIYNYSDKDDSVQVFNKLYRAGGQNVHKRVKHSFDELGRLKETKQYTDYSGHSNVFQTGYNYLDQKAKSTDAKGNVTNFSYDKYGNLSETDNADATSSFVNSTYQSGLTTAFYTLSNSFINKQEFIDETGRHYFKYFDAVGRLLRETKFVSEEIPDTDPYNPDSAYASEYTLPIDVALNTDYRYDSLYRVNCVETPAYKKIWYNYDNLGRQIKRITPDAGTTLYGYDINNNLLTSQDAKQLATAGDMYTYRSYDGLNRLVTISESQPTIFPSFADAINSENQLDFTPSNSDLLTVNVYDELIQNSSNPYYDIFSNTPSDYWSTVKNNTKGALVCTAFRTGRTDDWNYKFYRYDARGRVVAMWTYLDELGWKRENYTYNSQNQITSTQYRPNQTDAKSFANSYDMLGRLNSVSTYSGSNPVGQDDQNSSPQSFEQLAGYTYNPNSQILTSSFKSGMPTANYLYNVRNWVSVIRSSNSGGDFFVEGMDYNANGNISYQTILGSYKDNFSNYDDLYYHYTYDKSNRLLQADNTSATSEYYYDMTNTYDHDGNITKLIRNEDDKPPSDYFDYQYQSGTNKLLKVHIKTENEYDYDANGNLLHDDVNEVGDMKYDFRNLLLSCTSKNTDFHNSENGEAIYYTSYNYDEAGNRTSKWIWKYTGTDRDPHYPYGSWTAEKTDFYVRNINGAEVAVYNVSQAVQYWNIWGSDNVGKINANGDKEFYIKDHLGSVRCVITDHSDILSSQDFDCWGHKMNGRKYQTSSKYQFTSKERDIESDYDYFGARYYDSRIGKWGREEALYDKYIGISPYEYAGNNPIRNIDLFGQKIVPAGDNVDEIITELNKNKKATGLSFSYVKEGNYIEVSGFAKTKFAELILEASNDNNITVEFNIVTTNNFTTDQGTYDLLVGAYNGSSKEGDKITASQYYNNAHAKVWENAGGTNVGYSVMHEINEAYYGAQQFPGQGYTLERYLSAHNYIRSIEPEQYIPKDVYEKSTKTLFLKSKNNENFKVYSK